MSFFLHYELRHSKIVATILLLVIAASACASRNEVKSYELSGGIEMVLRGNAIVALDSISRLSEFKIMDIDNIVYDLKLGGVISFSTSKVDTEAPADPPPLSVRAFEAVTGRRQSILAGFGDGVLPSGMVAILDWSSDSAQSQEAGTRWNLHAVLADDGNGGLRFLGSESAILNSDLQVMRSQNPAVRDLELLVGTLAEEADSYGSGKVGPILSAFRQPASPEADWYALPLESRPLDPELTPQAELTDLVYRTILIEVAPEARSGNLEIQIQTSRGVSYRGTLEDNRQASILVPPAGDFELVTVDEAGSSESSRVDRFAFMAGAVTYIGVGRSSAHGGVSVAEIAAGLRTIATREQARAVVERWAVDGHLAPEPASGTANAAGR